MRERIMEVRKRTMGMKKVNFSLISALPGTISTTGGIFIYLGYTSWKHAHGYLISSRKNMVQRFGQ
jgi:hypothetical protein